MKKYKIEAKNKKEAVKLYLIQHFETYMCVCEKSSNTLYKLAKEV